MLPPVDQVCDSDDASTIAINSVSDYSVCAHVFGSCVSFLVDTGAAVSHASNELWERIKPAIVPNVNPVSMKLVGVDGACLQVQGLVTVEFTMSGHIFSQELIVANALTSERILGLNFLEANECVLDLHQGEMCSCGAKICLHAIAYKDRLQPK